MSAPALAVTTKAAISPMSRGSCQALKYHTKAATIAAAGGPGRARQPLEVALVGGGGARVEAREAQRRGHRVEEAGEPAEPSPEVTVLRDAHDAPLVGDDGGRPGGGPHI